MENSILFWFPNHKPLLFYLYIKEKEERKLNPLTRVNGIRMFFLFFCCMLDIYVLFLCECVNIYICVLLSVW